MNYSYAVSKGNFPCHLIECLKQRGNWTQVPEEDCVDTVDFYWRQVNLGFAGYDKVDKRLSIKSTPFIFNHFEVIRGITTKT